MCFAYVAVSTFIRIPDSLGIYPNLPEMTSLLKVISNYEAGSHVLLINGYVRVLNGFYFYFKHI